MYYILRADMCSDSNGGCHENADCVITPGSFGCVCRYGYYGNGTHCTGKCQTIQSRVGHGLDWIGLDDCLASLTLTPWQGGKPLTWDVTVVSTLAASYLSSSARSAGAAADPSLPVVKRRNIRASPTRIFFSRSQWNPTVRFVQVPSPSSPLCANA